jgi:oligopeptidase B
MIRSLGFAAVLGFVGACASAPEKAPTAVPPAHQAQPEPSVMAPAAPTGPTPPVAEKRPHEVRAPHGATREDEYYWLRDDKRENPDVLGYLRTENAYTDALLAPLAPTIASLYGEIVGRIAQDDESVPYRKHGYFYYTRFVSGKDYPVVARKKGKLDAPEEVMLDQNAMAEGKPYYALSAYQVSPNNRLLAYAEDTVGRRQYVIHVKNLATGELLPDAISGVAAHMVWADDNRTLWYVENDPTTLLTKRVKSHVLGTPVSEDKLVYEESDDTFYMGVMRTRSEKYLCVVMHSTMSSEQRCTRADRPRKLELLAERERGVEYQADHLKGRWVIRTNYNAPNFRIMTAKDNQWDERPNWEELVPHKDDVFIEGFELFDTFIAIDERSDALRRLCTLTPNGVTKFVVSDEPAYTMALGKNEEPSSKWLRYTYTSLTTPETTYDIHVDSDERKLLKRQPVPGGYDPQNYVTERLWANSRDGKRIPVSLVYRKGLVKNGTAAVLQYGYGSYGHSMDPYFMVALPSLLDRGVVYALAHVRGGQELGRKWYEDGKLLHKINTFHDFIDVTDFLVAEGYAAPKRVAALGGSAGGLLMGAVANMAPEKYGVILPIVPFVDVVTTMLDPTIPLTTNEYDEWGNPEQKTYYDYMLSYSPYDQLKAQDYPAMYVSTGLWDSQVQYYEPTKYVARLRAKKTDQHPLLLRTNMEAGHGGKSGRFRRYREVAEYYAFVLDQLKVLGAGATGPNQSRPPER